MFCTLIILVLWCVLLCDMVLSCGVLFCAALCSMARCCILLSRVVLVVAAGAVTVVLVAFFRYLF